MMTIIMIMNDNIDDDDKEDDDDDNGGGDDDDDGRPEHGDGALYESCWTTLSAVRRDRPGNIIWGL